MRGLRLTLSLSLISFVLSAGLLGCESRPDADDSLATVALSLSLGDDVSHQQIQLPAGDYTLEGEAFLAPGDDGLLSGALTVFDASGNAVHGTDLTFAAPDDATPEDLWQGQIDVSLAEGDLVGATLLLAREGDTPDAHLGFGVSLGEGPSIATVTVNPSRALEGQPITVQLEAVDSDGDSAGLSAFVRIGEDVFDLAPAANANPVDAAVPSSLFAGSFSVAGPGIHDIELVVVDEDGLETVDTKRIAILDAECAPAESVFVGDATGLDLLNLQGTDAASALYVDTLTDAIFEGLATNGYRFELSELDPTAEGSFITVADGQWKVDYVVRQSLLPGTACQSFERIDDEELALGESVASMNRGVCGAIATVHSLNKLGVSIPQLGSDLYVNGGADSDPQTQPNTDYIHPNYIKGIMNGGSLLSTSRLILMHVLALRTLPGKANAKQRDLCSETTRGGQAVAATNNRKPATPTKSKHKMKRFIKALKAAFDAGKDVTIIVDTPKGVPHAEHVTNVVIDPVTGVATVTTKNGYEQGNLKNTVPKDAGNNTWTLNPEGGAAFGGSTHADSNGYNNAINRQGGISSVKMIACGP